MTGKTTYGVAMKALAALAVAIASMILFSTSASASDRYVLERHHVKVRARDALGSPYRAGGTSKAGFDCSGLTTWAFDHGKTLPHSSQRQFDLAKQRGYVRIWKRKRLQVGDLVFQKTTSAQVGHVGIYIGRGRFISATSSHGVAIESVYDQYYWGPRWVGAVRLPITQKFDRSGA